MSSLGLILALTASVFWSGLDALRKVLASQLRPLPLAALLLAGQIPMFLVWAIWSGLTLPGPGYWLPGIADAVCALLASLLLVAALRASPLSITIPMLSLTPVFTALSASLLLGESLSPVQMVGIGLVVFGALLLSRPGPGSMTEPGVWMMIGVAGLLSLTATLDKAAMLHAPVAVHALLQALMAASGLLIMLAAQGRLKELSAIQVHKLHYLMAVLCTCGAISAQLFAYQMILVSIVEAIKRSVGLLLAILNGRVFFGEAITKTKLTSIVLMGTGVTVLALSGG